MNAHATQAGDIAVSRLGVSGRRKKFSCKDQCCCFEVCLLMARGKADICVQRFQMTCLGQVFSSLLEIWANQCILSYSC